MRTLYIDCGMGAAGDMLTAALLELLPNPEKFIKEVNTLGIPGVEIRAETSAKCGINGTHITVTVGGEEENEHIHDHHHEHGHDHSYEHSHDHSYEHSHDHEHSHDAHPHEAVDEHHHHSGLHGIEHIVSELSVSDKVKSDVMAIYNLIGEAESHAHGVPVTEIHFHEVGTMDAVADIVSVCLLMEKIAPQRVVVSPIHVGSGHVKCAHGMLPVPAPATAYILRDVPIYGGGIKSELCTPTGAAILKYFAASFGDMPVMKTSAIGYGMGKKDFTAANCVRVLLGETEDSGDTVTELSCNVDDMTPEAIGYAMNCLFEADALEVYTVPVGMKKNRPGTLLCVMCKNERKNDMVRLLFKHTTTLGIRENISRRYTLSRRMETVSGKFGDVRKKISTGFGVTREKFEYDDIVRVAKAQDMSMSDAIKIIETQGK